MTNIIPQINRKRVKKVVAATVSVETYNKLTKIHGAMSYLNQSQLIDYCISTVFDYKLFGSDAEKIEAMRTISAQFPVYVREDARKAVDKKDPEKEVLTKEALIAKYGGETVNGVTKYTKYEVTAMGDVVTMNQSMPLRSLPDGEEELRKFILGPYSTLAEAQIEYDKANQK